MSAAAHHDEHHGHNDHGNHNNHHDHHGHESKWKKRRAGCWIFLVYTLALIGVIFTVIPAVKSKILRPAETVYDPYPAVDSTVAVEVQPGTVTETAETRSAGSPTAVFTVRADLGWQLVPNLMVRKGQCVGVTATNDRQTWFWNNAIATPYNQSTAVGLRILPSEFADPARFTPKPGTVRPNKDAFLAPDIRVGAVIMKLDGHIFGPELNEQVLNLKECVNADVPITFAQNRETLAHNAAGEMRVEIRVTED